MTGDLSRYHRQMLVHGVGAQGQRRLGRAHAVIVGCGALGCEAADLLARAGIGTLTLIDRDVVEWTNLQRQRLYAERDAAAGTPKAEAAAARLAEINSGVRVRPMVLELRHRDAERVLLNERPDVIIDGTDNFAARYLINDVAVKHRVPYVYGGVVATRGMQMSVVPGGPCLRCVFPDAPEPGSAPTCDTAGVLGPAVEIVAGFQAADAIRIMLGMPEAQGPALLEFDLWTRRTRQITVEKDPACKCCAGSTFEALDGLMTTGAAYLCGQNAVQVHPRGFAGDRGEDDADEPPRVMFETLAQRLMPHGAVTRTRFMLRVSLEAERGDDGGPVLMSIFPDGRALFRGIRNPDRARVLYERYVG